MQSTNCRNILFLPQALRSSQASNPMTQVQHATGVTSPDGCRQIIRWPVPGSSAVSSFQMTGRPRDARLAAMPLTTAFLWGLLANLYCEKARIATRSSHQGLRVGSGRGFEGGTRTLKPAAGQPATHALSTSKGKERAPESCLRAHLVRRQCDAGISAATSICACDSLGTTE